MATLRKNVFRNEEFYHIFNRGIDKRTIFLSKRDYSRAIETIWYYQYSDPPVKFSDYLKQPYSQKLESTKSLKAKEKIVEIVAYCLMPNHFHFLLKQKKRMG